MSTISMRRRAMRPFGDLTPYDEALAVALAQCAPIAEMETVPLPDAMGRCAADDIVASDDVPTSDRAAMDGYAVIAADLRTAGVTLHLRGRVMAGNLERTALAAGECWEVATGAPMPAGADAVVPVENTENDGDEVRVRDSVACGDHVSQRGEDLVRGDVVLSAGAVITAASLAAVASLGVLDIAVRRRPRVLVVPTGDELVARGERLRPGQVYDSNSVGVAALLSASGAAVDCTPIVRDDPQALIDGINSAGYDLVVTLGGTSVGRHDLVLEVVGGLGEVLVHGIALKPGKPVLVARVGDTPVLGLPGFPTSCVFTAYTFAEPMVRTLAGLPLQHRRKLSATLTAAVRSPREKLQFLTVVIEDDRALPAYKASSTISSMSGADGWIEIPAGIDRLGAGDAVEVTLF